MVDALRRAHRIVTPDGTVVELHPSASAAVIEVSDRAAGHVHTGDAPIRHAAAGAAIASAVAEGLFAVERVVTFPFYSYADTIEELREYIEENWRDARVEDDTANRTRALLRGAPGVRPRAREHVILTVLRPRHVHV
jgi:hypothetical protein